MPLPDSFLSRLASLLGEGSQAVAEALCGEPVVSVRLNPFKACGTLAAAPVPWASHAYYLEQRPNFTFDPLFHAGCYYVQEASSMFIEQVVRQYVTSPACVLDLCAAPGGKSTHLRSILPDGSLLVCNELIKSRAAVLVENIVKWGHPDVVVTNNAPEDFAPLGELFDVVVADVPCSGEGMFRKDATAIAEWREQSAEVCQKRGRSIIRACWPALKPGGLLVYSTCTFNLKENEENVAYFREELGAEVLELAVRPEWNITGNLLSDVAQANSFPVYRFLPGRTRGEGFFLAVLRKPADAPCDKTPSGGTKRVREVRSAIPSVCKEWVARPDAYAWSLEDGTVLAHPLQSAEVVSLLRKNLHVLHSGIAVAVTGGANVQPSQCLADSICLAGGCFPRVDVSYSDALAFLRREALRLPSSAAKGYVLLTFKDVPLGFVKNVGTRANNLYVNEWRIRTTHLPSEEFTLLD